MLKCPAREAISICHGHSLSIKQVNRPVGFMQLCHLLFQLLRLSGGKLEVTEVVTVMLFRIIVSKFSLQCVRSQQDMSHKRAGQAARGNVLPELKAQEVSARSQREKRVAKEQLVRIVALILPIFL